MPIIVADLITAALQEINVSAAGETPSAEEMALGVSKFNLILDTWATDEFYVWNKDFNIFPITPNHQPHLIGPGLTAPDYAAVQRPMKIEAANLVLTNSVPNVSIPLGIRDDDWWAQEHIKTLTGTNPTDLYYSPAVPNGQIFLWPVPTVAYNLELEIWTLLSQVSSSAATLTLPPGYQSALTYSLAETWPGIPPDPLLIGRAKNARLAIQGVNVASPRMGTVDSGVPTGAKARSTWNFRTGSYR